MVPPFEKMSQPNEIKWYKNAAMDAPELKSPQPCSWGIFCDYQIVDKTTGERVPGCCKGVHPGEEGTGRRIFPERQVKDRGPDGNGTTIQPRCVRLTGRAGFYERRRLRLSWKQWCEREGIPFPTGSRTALKVVPFGNKKQSPQPPPRIDLSPESGCEVRLTAYSEDECSSPCLLSSGATCLLRTEGLEMCCEEGLRMFPSCSAVPAIQQEEQSQASPVPRGGRMPERDDLHSWSERWATLSGSFPPCSVVPASQQVEVEHRQASPVPAPVVQKRRGRPPKNKSSEGGATPPLCVLASGGGGSCEEDEGAATPLPSALTGGGCSEGDMEAQD